MKFLGGGRLYLSNKMMVKVFWPCRLGRQTYEDTVAASMLLKINSCSIFLRIFKEISPGNVLQMTEDNFVAVFMWLYRFRSKSITTSRFWS